MSNKIKIAILGFGTIGKGTYDLILENKEKLKDSIGSELEVRKILEISKETIQNSNVDINLFTADYDEILNDDEISIVIEVMGGVEPALSFILKAFEKGKSVVTSNKAMVAPNYQKIYDNAKNNSVHFRYEASVGGGIPIIDVLTNAMSANKIESVLGILNGSTNYILTKMKKEKLSYEEALKNAQDLGFAEKNPSDDVDGIDAANKLSILISLITGKYLPVSDIKPTGITKIKYEDMLKAEKQDCVVKLIASATFDDNGVLSYFVQPTYLNKEHPLASVSDENNGVLIKGNMVDEIMLYGKGAGALPTASAVVSDIVSIIKEQS